MITLHDIIQGCKNANPKYQKLLYERFYGFGLKIAFRYIFKYEKAVDAVNDGFVKVFRGFNGFFCENIADEEKVLMGWIKKIMANTAIDQLRIKITFSEISEIPEYVWDQQDETQTPEQKLFYKEIICLVKKMSPRYRIIFNMYVVDGFSHREIATSLGISLGASKSSLSKARLQMQKLINQQSTEKRVCPI